MGMHHEIQPTWTLILGKGPATSPLEPILRGLAPANLAVRIEFLEGSAPALPAPSRRGRLVLDAAALDGQGLIHVRQYLAEATGWELILLDREGVPCLARELVGPPHIYWWPGPTTVEQATRLFHPPRARDSAQLGEPASVPETAAALLETVGARKQSPLQFTDPDEELGAIQAILSAPLEDDEGPDPDWIRAPEEPGLDDLDDLETCGELDPLAPMDMEEGAFIRNVDYDPEREDSNMHFPVGDPFAAPTAAQPDHSWLAESESMDAPASSHPVDLLLRSLAEAPSVSLEQALADSLPADPAPLAPFQAPTDWQDMPWYKGQIADLNDLAQRLHLDLFALEEDASLAGHSIAMALREDVARLAQFARTLSFLAAPPAQGNQTFSLATLVQEQLGALTGLGPEAPRFLLRTQSNCEVRSDKMLLVSALDALLQVAGQCAGQHPATVRVECLAEASTAQIRIGFDPGPIDEFTAEEAFEPYALRTCLEGIGPNALSAARSILRGQGGDLSLEKPHDGACTFVLTLPLA